MAYGRHNRTLVDGHLAFPVICSDCFFITLKHFPVCSQLVFYDCSLYLLFWICFQFSLISLFPASGVSRGLMLFFMTFLYFVIWLLFVHTCTTVANVVAFQFSYHSFQHLVVLEILCQHLSKTCLLIHQSNVLYLTCLLL